MEIHEQPTQYFEPQLSTEPVLRIPQQILPPDDLVFSANERQRRWKRPSFSVFIVTIMLSLCVLMFATILMAGGWLYQSSFLMPGVTVMGLDLGQQTKQEAIVTLQMHWDAQTVTMVDGLENWTVLPADLGVTFDASATVELAHQQGRSVSSWRAFFQNEGQFPLQPVWQLDPNVAETFLMEQAGQRNVAPIDAHIEIVNGRVKINPAVDGRELDVPATKGWLMENGATVVMNGRLPLITNPVPATITDVSATAAQAEALLTTSVAINAYDPINDFEVTWIVSPAIWGEWLTMAVDPANQSQFNWSLDREAGTLFFQERMAALGPGRFVETDEALTAVSEAIQSGDGDIRLRIFHTESNYTVLPGDTLASIGRQVGFPYPWLQQANPLVGEALAAGQNISVPSPDVLLPLPIVENKRIVVSISEQRVWVYENGALKWDWLASTGIASSPTNPGIFQIQAHYENAYAGIWDLHMPNFMSVYQPAPGVEFFNGFHGFPTRDGVNLLWTQNLGAPVTYGCILLSNENIALLYEWAEPGVVVEIRP